MTTDLRSRLRDTLDTAAIEHGLELVDVEIAGARHAPLVRVMLDREGGIDLDSIAEATRWVSAILDESSGIDAAYTLEVSSPGIERPLVKPRDFERFAGQNATIATTQPVEGRRNFTGRLDGIEGDLVVLDVDGAASRIPLAVIRRARLKVDININDEGSGRTS